ncbi:hypothetical protein [Rhizobium favelukesii]|uniref:hypothetical protein n=1 Tax=Rhizobium favelukesii TaxID=348824 RepID=UPI00055CD585|nr:hypothetical protein [Rhizobium favelukesii]
MSDTDAFPPLEAHCYVRQAETEDGRQGWALIDSDGEVELFSENRSDVFFYAAAHEIRIVQTN